MVRVSLTLTKCSTFSGSRLADQFQNDVTKPCFLTTTATTTSWVLWLPFRKRIKAIDIIQTMLRIEIICLNRVSVNDVAKLDIVRIQLEFVKLAQKKELQVYNVFFPWTYC